MFVLKQVRTRLNISASQLSRDSGISLRTIQDAEKKTDCKLSTAAKLAKTMGVPIDELWQDEDNKENAIKRPLLAKIKEPS